MAYLKNKVLNNQLIKLLTKNNKFNLAANVAIPESKALRTDNKTFYFDCGSTARGIFLRISEVYFHNNELFFFKLYL